MDINLVLFKKNGSHKVFPLPSNVTVIGRRRACDLCIPLMLVSKRHCQLSYQEDALQLRDLGSRNGTYLNGKRIDEAAVRPGDYLKVGPLIFLLQVNGQPNEIVPPKQTPTTSSKQTKPKTKASTDGKPSDAELSGPDDFAELDESDSFVELDEGDDLPELDESDSDITDLENI